MVGMRFALPLLAVLIAFSAAAQQPAPTPLAPSEAMKAARAPFDAARAQPGDLTAADELALGVGMQKAAKACAAMDPKSYRAQPPELLSLARLCMFGQGFEPARQSLVLYLEIPQPPERETAMVLLVQALLGLKEPGEAVPQEFSLLRDYPLDPQIDLSLDAVVDKAEGASGPLTASTLQLCGTQNAATLPLLETGKGLPGKDGALPPEKLFADSLRCATLDRMTGDIAYRGTMKQLTAIAAQPSWQGTAQLAPIQEMLAQAEMVSAPLALKILYGSVLSGKQHLGSGRIALDREPVVLMPFVLWSPSATSMIHTLALSVPPGRPLYAITSWAANTGGPDLPSPEMLKQLGTWQSAMPPGVPLLIVPDKVLQQFHVQSYPGGIVIGGGDTLLNTPLDSEGAVRLLLLALQSAGQPPAHHRTKTEAGSRK
jgi:hypothetical protein